MNLKKHAVLTLNRGWTPIHVITWQKAMSLIYKEHARPIDRELIIYNFADWIEFSRRDANDYCKIGTTTGPIALPEIIALTIYDRLPQRDVKFSRQNVFIRDKYTCQYCGRQFKKEELTIDHIIPESQGGKKTWDNIVACCKKCNARKRDDFLHIAQKRYPILKLKRKPQKPKWYNPLSSVISKVHECKSWEHFMKRIDTSDTVDKDGNGV